MSRRSWVVRRGSLLLLTLLLAFAVRLVSIGRYVTPDEPAWVERSARFAHALSTRDWEAVPATGHPGVTTMWVGAAGIGLRRWLQPAASAAHLQWILNLAWLAPENAQAFRHLSFFLPYGRIGVALVTSLALLPIYGMARRLFDPRVALVTVGLLAFEPFLVGHSGLLHTDALLATFSTLALLAGLNGLRAPRPAVWWALAGLCTGLALLTKTPALFLLPFLPLLLLVHSLVTRTSQTIPARLLSLGYSVPFLLVAGATVFALYPALWADPSQVMEMVSLYAGESSRATLLPVFFLGQLTLEPGPAFYPLAFLLRISPVVLIGLLAGLVRLRRFDPRRRFTLLALLAFSLLFTIALSLNVKRFDRYLLPAIAPLALVAGAGLSARRPTPLLPRHLLPVVLQLVLLLPFAAYPLTYANPLLGGPPAARHVLSTSWGEGPGAAARWLNRLPDAEELVVATHTIPSFASMFTGRTVGMEQAGLADYTLHSSAGHASDSLHHPSAYTATVGFVHHTLVVTQALPPLQAETLSEHAAPEDLIVVDAGTPLLRRYRGPGTIRSAAGLADEASLAAWLAEHMPAHGSTWVVSVPGGSPITAAHLDRRLGALATPVSTTTLSGSTIVRFIPLPSPQSTSPPPFRAAFGGRVRLVDGIVEARSAWPEPVRVVLRWQTPQEVPTAHHVVLALVDAQGHVWRSLERPVLNAVDFHIPAWTAGEWADRFYELPLPAAIPPGEYSVEISLYDAASGAGLGAAGPGGEFLGTRVPVGRVTILPPAAPPPRSALEMPVTPEQPAGELTLLGVVPPAEEVYAGDVLDFELFWEAAEVPASDHTVHLQLVDAAGTITLEQEVPLSPYPTSRWRAGARYASRYRLHVPPRLAAGDYELRAGGVGALNYPLGRVTVLPRERSFELPPALPYSSTLAFGDLVVLRGYGPEDLHAAPGGSLPLRLVWQAQGWSERSYTLFVHLVGPDGAVYAQIDRVPGGGMAPTTSWAPGQVLVEEIELPIRPDAPPGTYHIGVGFYDPLHGGSLPVDGQQDAAGRALLPLEITITGGNP